MDTPPPTSPSDSVLRRIEGFARTSHDSGYEQGYVDAYNHARKVLARRGLVYLLLGLILGGSIVMLLAQRGVFGEASAPAPDPRDLGMTRGLRFKAAADYARDYTVYIQVASPTGGWSNSERLTQSGSGFLYDDEGHIVTNNHVVAGGSRFFVTWKGRQYEADAIGTNRKTDVAILQIHAANMKGAALIDPEQKVQLAEEVLAVGSPFGLATSVTQGIVSFVGRRIDDGTGIAYLQTDCAINTGNSGGPLVNLEGRVVGMNRMIYSKSGTGENTGVGFAIPLDVVKKSADEILTSAKKPPSVETRGTPDPGVTIETAYIGVKFPPGYDDEPPVIAEIMPGSPAAFAGLKARDVVAAIDSLPIRSRRDLQEALAQDFVPDQQVKITIARGKETLTLPLTLGAQQRRTIR
jgi:S1-C subfamily serine protease